MEMPNMGVDPVRLKKDLSRCEEAVHAARTLLVENLYAESISRAYYAVIHSVMLLLVDTGTDTRNPVEAERLFTTLFVEEHGLNPEFSILFQGLCRAKRATDHDFLAKYSGDDARESITKARAFIDLTRTHFGLEVRDYFPHP
jgi:uncharacterized protein (UPF0332 family)